MRVYISTYLLFIFLFVVYMFVVMLCTYLALVLRLLLGSYDNESIGVEEAVDWSMFGRAPFGGRRQKHVSCREKQILTVAI